jgi:hypothetical protein
MQFSVITADETETFYDGKYKVEDYGVLRIVPDDDDMPTIRLSPTFWRRINEPRVAYDIRASIH